MLYSILKILMRITVRIFFRSITIRNGNVIPEKGPLLVLANHPSTFMDPIVIATILKRKVYFLGKGELFKSKFAKWLLPKLNIIPVYRKQDDPSQMSKNEETFIKCYEHFEKGGAILMFPEGVSITERKLRPIKTGASRIVLGAEDRNDFNLGVQIINIGLNYEDPHRFNRDLFVNIHKPIKVADYKGNYKKDNFEGAKSLTLTITKQLEKLIIAIEDDKTEELVKDIETLYKSRLSEERGLKEKEKDGEFFISKNIVETVNYFLAKDRERVEAIRLRLKTYFKNLGELDLNDDDILQKENRSSFMLSTIRAFLIVFIGAPIWLFGLVNNFLPFEIPGWLAGKIIKQKEFRGAIGMVGGMFTFLIFYSIQIITIWKITNIIWITVAYAICLPLSGLFAYWYYYRIKEIRTKWLLMILFFRKNVYISKLITEREQIISEFDKAKIEYYKVVANNKLHPDS